MKTIKVSDEIHKELMLFKLQTEARSIDDVLIRGLKLLKASVIVDGNENRVQEGE